MREGGGGIGRKDGEGEEEDDKDSKDGSEDALPCKGQQMGELRGGVGPRSGAGRHREAQGGTGRPRHCFFCSAPDAVNTVRDGS